MKERPKAALLMRSHRTARIKDLISSHQHQSKCCCYNRFLITVDVLGSTGPIRFIVNEDELVDNVIYATLKSYARQDRRPVLGFDPSNFLLHCANAEFKVMEPTEVIGSCEGRKFVLSKKKQDKSITDDETNGTLAADEIKSLNAKDAKKYDHKGDHVKRKELILSGLKTCYLLRKIKVWRECLIIYYKSLSVEASH